MRRSYILFPNPNILVPSICDLTLNFVLFGRAALSGAATAAQGRGNTALAMVGSKELWMQLNNSYRENAWEEEERGRAGEAVYLAQGA